MFIWRNGDELLEFGFEIFDGGEDRELTQNEERGEGMKKRREGER